MSLHEAKECGCSKEIGMTEARTRHYCEHGHLLVYVKALGSKPASPTKPRKPLKRGKGMGASPEQRQKVRNLPCVVCGQNSGFDIGDGGGSFVVEAAHIYPRNMCPCEHADGVIPLCHDHHLLYDNPSRRSELDLLPKLVDRDYNREMAHYISEHGFSLLTLLQHITGEKWQPVESPSGVVG
jgi:hypothetical protein